jgi:predicted RNA-binding Zn-ribbon protein involved in translation (DUF1610 family)
MMTRECASRKQTWTPLHLRLAGLTWLANTLLSGTLARISTGEVSPSSEDQPMSELRVVSVLYFGVVEVECPECESRTRLQSLEERGRVIKCSSCGVELYVEEDADFEIDEDLVVAAGGNE